MNKPHFIHAPLEPMKIDFCDSILYNMEVTSYSWQKGTIFGITCQEGKVPLFEIMTAEGYVFSDVPPHLIRWNHKSQDLKLEELVYNNCPSSVFTIICYDYLKTKPASVKIGDRFVVGEYQFSVDFYENYNWFHCMKLENGQFCFIPSHKMVFGVEVPEDFELPAFKKLRKTFSV